MVGGKPQYVMIPARLVKADPRAAFRLADRKRQELVAQRDDGLAGSTPLLSDYLRSWIGSLEKNRRVVVTTLDGYRSISEQHIIPVLGAIRVDRLSVRDVQRWIDGQGGAARSVKGRLAVLHSALARAGSLVTRNVADPKGVIMPRVAEYEGNPFTADEAIRFGHATSDDPYGALWLLAIETGWRQGELLGLARDSIDLEAGQATPPSQLVRRHGSWGFRATKRPRRLAVVSLSPFTVEVLRRHLVRTAEARDPSLEYFGLLFLTARGNPV